MFHVWMQGNFETTDKEFAQHSINNHVCSGRRISNTITNKSLKEYSDLIVKWWGLCVGNDMYIYATRGITLKRFAFMS